MTRAHQMLETYPRDVNVDLGLLARAIEALEDCAYTCTQCADSCLAEPNIARLAKCIRLTLDCADVCVATRRVISRRTEYDANVTRVLLEACIAACRSCGEECERHAQHMAQCRVCAESCRQCDETCRELLAAVS